MRDPRKEIIKGFYKSVLGREADQKGLDYYLQYEGPLEVVYMMLYTSDEAENRRKSMAAERKALGGSLPITLAVFVKDAEESIGMCINSARDLVRETIVVDTGSSDSTVEICRSLGARVYEVGFTDFGNIRTLTAHLATQPWVLGLDSDETVLRSEYHLFKPLVEDKDVDAWGLPRKRWLDLGMTTQLEKEVYPDWQYRLIRNKPHIRYKRRVHEIIDGTDKTMEAEGGPHIHHFQDAFKSGARLKARNQQYKALQSMDLRDGVEHTGRAVEEIDER